MLSVNNLWKTFTVHVQEATIQAVRGLSFSLNAGEICALVGPSGAGKSTVLKCIYRTYLPSGGSIQFSSEEGMIDLASAEDLDVAAVRARDLGFVTQFLHCLPRKSALDVVAAPLYQQRVDGDEARARAAALLEDLGIPKRLWDLPPATFSGGERQRVNIARGLVRKNRLLLLDEPTASLDADSAERVVGLIDRARSAGTAIVAIWHDRAIVERLADQTVHIDAASRNVMA